jgi:hypothetical protein
MYLRNLTESCSVEDFLPVPGTALSIGSKPSGETLQSSPAGSNLAINR